MCLKILYFYKAGILEMAEKSDLREGGVRSLGPQVLPDS